MSDNRVSKLSTTETNRTTGIRIEKISLSNYRYFSEKFEFPVRSQNILLYGENGSGKSSIYNAIELLTKTSFEKLNNSQNIFSEGKEVSVEFLFSSGQTLTISSDMVTIPDSFSFLSGLPIFAPVLDYKKLLKIHYAPDLNGHNVNLYSLFRILLKNYPIENGVLGDKRDLNDYFVELKKILKQGFIDEINRYLSLYFEADIQIASFETSTPLDDETEKAIPTVHLNIDYLDTPIRTYHSFLNEAKLSALAISTYFVAIKKLMNTLRGDRLKILVLDDLLISLDMSNRLRLFSILQKEFSDFQIFFFTHDKELYELYKSKMSWKNYELYADNNQKPSRPILKNGDTAIEKAKRFYAEKEFDACGIMIRKYLEQLIKNWLPPQDKIDAKFTELKLSMLILKAVSKTSGETQEILKKLNSDRKHILNPLSHADNRNVYDQEIRSAIEDLEKLERLLK